MRGKNLNIIGAGGNCSTAGEIPDLSSAAAGSALHAGKNFGGNALVVTLGCAKNQVDSEIMLGALSKRGFRIITEPAAADLIVVNTCAFLQSAVEEGVDRILEMARFKKEGRCRRLIVAGCMVERYRDQLRASLPEVDRFISTDELLRVADEDETTAECLDNARRPYFLYDESMPRIRSTLGHTAYLKIAEGCDRPCAFCIIPKIRGAFRSRLLASVVKEARDLLSQGVRELNLVAQDLTSYGADFAGNRGLKNELPSLLRALGELHDTQGDFWVRLMYAYPIGVNEELLREIVANPVVCKYLDLPLQHITHRVLKSMRRPLGENGTRRLIEEIRHTAPSLSLRTTFVVGFPGETEEDVSALEQFVREGHFMHVGVFTYSQEEEAISFSFPDQVDEEVKRERCARIMTAQQDVVSLRLAEFLGARCTVLVEGAHADTNLLYVGRTDWQAPEIDGEVIINDASDEFRSANGDLAIESLVGSFVTVEITETAGYDLVASIVETSEPRIFPAEEQMFSPLSPPK